MATGREKPLKRDPAPRHGVPAALSAAGSAEITVLAGVNGAGKSSVAGEMLLRHGEQYYNPDRETRHLLTRGLAPEEANGAAWEIGRRKLSQAIRDRLDFAFETTLGGETMTALLRRAAAEGLRVRVLYVGLATLELHLQRVQARVTRGGHDIPEAKIRARWRNSRRNLIRLLPHLAELLLWDNSAEVDADSGVVPTPVRLLWIHDGVIRDQCAPEDVPAWAKPIFAAALKRDPPTVTGS